MTSIDPSAKGGIGYAYIGQFSLETLLQITPDGKLQPWLAQSWSQPSPTEYVYNLRHGVKFWDGTELTADDVVASLTYEGGGALGKGAGFFGSISKIDARDNYTVVITLNKPDASFKYTPGLVYTEIFEKKFQEAHKNDFGKPGTLVMGTGPWKIDSLDPTTGAEFSANPTYWGGEPQIKHVTVKFYASETSLALAMRAGQVDIDPVVASPDSFKSASGVAATTAASCSTAYLSMPTQTGSWSDVHVRRAVAYALDKSELLKAMGGADPSVLESFVPKSQLLTLGSPSEVAAALKSVTTYPYSIDKAKQEMAQSTHPNGFSASMTSTSDQATLRISQAIAAQLKQIGINLQIKSVSPTQFVSIILGPAGKRPPMFFSEGGCFVPDASWTPNLFFGALNEANYHKPAVDQLVAEGLSTQDPKQRLQIYTKIMQHTATDVPYVPLFNEGFSYASTKYDWVNFGNYWQNTRWLLNVKPRG